jgi:molecular chaperone GrpE
MENEEKMQARAAEEPEGEEPRKQKETGEPAAEASTPASEAPAQDLPADLPTAYRNLLAEKKELYDRLLRKQAELENFRKRIQREKEDFLQHATADLIRALLPVLDSFERALKHRNADVPEQFYHGMELIYRELLDVLSGAGLTPIDTAGKIFDAHLHEAVETVTGPGYRDHEIVEELQRGYKLRHRLLRPAVVKVAVRSGDKNPASGEGNKNQETRQADEEE